MDLHPYPAYKDSGVPWLGEVPEHWEVRRMKTLLRERSLKGFPDEPLLAATQTKGVVRKEHYENRTVLATKDLHLLKLVREGDFVISLRSFQGGIEYAREQGIISPAYTILYPKEPKFHGYIAWLFKSKPFIENLSLFVTGIREGQNIDYEKLSRSVLPLPPLPEQVAIVRFLDFVDRRIRRSIRAKRKLIALLNEQKQAIIHQAVTRGLDQDVPMKDSGVEWLGEVPEHWTIKKLKSISPRISGRLVYSPAQYFCESGIPFLFGTNVTEDGFSFKKVKYIPHEINERFKHHALREGDLVMVRVGAPGLTTVVPIEAEGLNCASMMIIRKDPGFNSKWLACALNSKIGKIQVDTVTYGAAQVQINISDAVNFIIPTPPLNEQSQITESLDRQISKILSITPLIYNSIEFLLEYRTRLIADVVTGKLDVHTVAANLPEKTEEPELLDEDKAPDECDEEITDINATSEEAEA